MNHRIVISQPTDDNMGSSIYKLLELLPQFENVNEKDSVIVDLNNITFAYPFLILPLSSLIGKLKESGCEVSVIGHLSYLGTILFPDGFTAIGKDNWTDSLNYYRDRTYLPICQIPAGADNTSIRENLLSVFETILRQQLNITGQLLIAISYLISETMDNIVDHAGVSNGWIMVQNYPAKHFLDICILDTGVGIRGSYINHNFTEIENDQIAIQQAINGQSTKQIAETRGYGINTTRRMLVEGIKGKYFLFSGAAFYIYTNELEQITPLDRSKRWEGTMLALRIPRDIPDGFNYADYLE
jgi:hypothetical protein